MGDIVEHWYAVLCIPNGEDKADTNLRREGYATFYPRNRKRFRRKRPHSTITKVVTEDKPLFPGYIFFGVKADQGLFAAKEADGVAAIVSFGQAPLKIPHKIMDKIMARTDANGIAEFIDEVAKLQGRGEFKEGARMAFADDSPFSKFIAVIKQDFGKEVSVWLEEIGEGREIRVAPELLKSL